MARSIYRRLHGMFGSPTARADRFIRAKGGAYMFAPSLPTLKKMASG